MSSVAACTIVSKNYLAYARTLSNSFKKQHPDTPFYVLLVDEMGDFKLDMAQETFELFEVRSIGIKNFQKISFRFNILELNTNVKPGFLKFLMEKKGHQKVFYFDPDIMIMSSLQSMFDSLDAHQILLTPHANAPVSDGKRPSEQDFLSSGAFNLGYVGVKNTPNGMAFLDWWADRCLTLGFQEIRAGLFVDQKWCNLAPCFFDEVGIIKHPGWNMAYWNLHERKLAKKGDDYQVNSQYPLMFFHFSGVAINDGDRISKHTDRYDLVSRPELKELFVQYRDLLVKNGMNEFKKLPYKYGIFSNGKTVTQLARSLYAANEDLIPDADPFDTSGRTYAWCQASGLMGKPDTSGQYTAANFKPKDWRVRAINFAFRTSLRVLGADKYTVLMKYLSYITILRNQNIIYRFK